MTTKYIQLHSGVLMPIFGLGTWQLTGPTCTKAVSTALELGYRHIDTAWIYGNHHEVGTAIRQSNIPRQEIFVTTKVWRDNLSAERILTQCQESLEELGLEYVDQLLIHFPNSYYAIEDSMQGLMNIKEKGLARSVGVSNFTINHLKNIKNAGYNIDVNQVELHPTLMQPELREYCQQEGIALVAYSPLARGQDLALPSILEIAVSHNVTPSQIILAYLMAHGLVVIPKASSKNHLEENLASLNIILSPDEIARIDEEDKDMRLINPEYAEF